MPSDAAAPAPWVLMYHSVAEGREDPCKVTVSPRRLAAHLGWLRRAGLTGVGVGELLRARAEGRGRGLVGLTFDDGYADFLTGAVPLLRAYGHRATVFVLSGRLGGDNAWDAEGPRRALLDAEGVRAAAQAGMEVGSHGLLHRDLTACEDAALAAEAAGSRQILGALTGEAPAGFCYPYGAVNARAVAAVRASGYAYACAVTPPAGLAAGPYALPRAYVGERDHAGRLLAKGLLHRMPAARSALRRGAGTRA
ncbi:polysaccharide deacetylase family protein [Streptomyces sp. NRRL F-5123]|uniref:polysaccharide deacetylase family protein n=1 Tax=Streptomyces sp. NRRL F-5123 TaxID=1463856 RepID=UPI0006933944|nr:polysaccharide deacetylase family protein [Streptomyces sp. NRRL F-5123]